MAERARVVGFITDSDGDVIPSASIEVRDPGTANKITPTIYAADDPDAATLANPFTSGADGKVLFYLVDPKRVDLFVSKSGFTSQTIPVDVQKSTLLGPHALTGADHTASGLTTDHVVKATGAATFAFALDPVSDKVTTKGDILAATAADTLARKAAGADDTILMARAAEADGLAWQAPATTAEIADVDTGAESAGTSDTWPRGDHKHALGNDAVTFAKMQNIATDRLLGRDTAATGDPEELTVGGGLEFSGAGGIQRSALTGDVTASAGGAATTLAAAFKEEYATFSKAGVLTVAAGTHRYYVDAAYTIVEVRASVGTAPTGASLIVDVNKNGTTIFTTQANRPTIAVSTNTDGSNVPDVTTLADGDYLIVDTDQIGSGTAGSDLTVQVVLRRT